MELKFKDDFPLAITCSKDIILNFASELSFEFACGLSFEFSCGLSFDCSLGMTLVNARGGGGERGVSDSEVLLQ